jgi:hypothetical protein
VDEQLDRAREANAAHLAAGAEQNEAEERAREQRLRSEAELRDAQLDALRGSSEELARTLESLRAEAGAARSELAAPLRRQLDQLDRAQQQLERAAAEAEGDDDTDPSGGGTRKRRFFRRS